MLINLRNALMAGKRLPYDAEVEYLESTGTQWIDTGVYGSEDLIVDAVWAYSSSGASAAPFGSRVSATSNAYSVTGYALTVDNRMYVSFGNRPGWMSSTTTNLYGHIWQVHMENGNGRLLCDGAQITSTNTTVGSFTTPTTIPLFAYDENTTRYFASGVRFISFRMWSTGGTLVRDYIPVRKGTVGYLYDRVSGKLFGNAGTGDFVLGEDVVPMTWQDGLQYNSVGTPIESATSSIGLDYIPITAGHSFTWRLGYGSSASADLIIYNANKGRIDYWVARDRTVTISGAAAYMRISALTSYKNQATVYDETAQKYVFANGRIPAE